MAKTWELPLWRLSLLDAMSRRFKNGRLEHGEKWGGVHPLVEAYEELIDTLVYAQLVGGEEREWAQYARIAASSLSVELQELEAAGVDLTAWEFPQLFPALSTLG